MVNDLLNLKASVKDIVSKIKMLDENSTLAAKKHLDNLAKPVGSLGKLEDIVIKLSGIFGECENLNVDKREVIVFAADNGVVAEGVASAPQSVTVSQSIEIAEGKSGVSVLARHANADVKVIDIGVAADLAGDKIIRRKIAYGTKNFAKEPAMSELEVYKAIITGIYAAIDAHNEGYKMLGVGEMGIGNTTTSSAVICGLLGINPNDSRFDEAIGRGAGLSESQFQKKKRVIANALDLHKPVVNDAIDVLQKVGGFDIAGMAGLYIGAAYCKIPVVIDGLISIVAALCASKICPAASEYMIASHKSYERGYAVAAAALGVEPVLRLNMRLGEGSGCPLMFGIIDGACAVFNEMATFEEASVDLEYLDSIKNIDF